MYFLPSIFTLRFSFQSNSENSLWNILLNLCFAIVFWFFELLFAIHFRNLLLTLNFCMYFLEFLFDIYLSLCASPTCYSWVGIATGIIFDTRMKNHPCFQIVSPGAKISWPKLTPQFTPSLLNFTTKAMCAVKRPSFGHRSPKYHLVRN